MKKITILFTIIVLAISSNLFAQRKTDIDGGKDYPLVTRFEGSVIEFCKEVKWDDYQIPVNFDEGFLEWEEPAKLEGKLFRNQYSVSSDNNPSYVLKVLKSTLEKSGFEIVFAKNNKEMGLKIDAFTGTYYRKLGNTKCGYAYKVTGSDQSYIVAKTKKDGKDIYVSIYISGFSNITLITQTVIEAESFTQKKVIATVFKDSRVGYDDKMGFGEFTVCTSKSPEGKVTTKKVEGYIRHRFCYAPGGRSSLEIVKNYEEAILKNGGKVLVSSKGKGECFDAFMKRGHPDHGLTNYEYLQFGRYANYYFSGKVSLDRVDYYVIVVTSNIEGKLVFTLITIETKPMERGMVSVDNLNNGISTDGHIAVYDIHFETGEYVVMEESIYTLNSIAEYLNANKDKKFFIVGHTDNVGDFSSNMTLSENRAKAIMDELVTKCNVDANQLESYGAASLSPVTSNSTDEGKAKNRRVEIVEQ